ncbi:hypothetical protein PVAP13_9NG451619 [Panicum virgatum]|uniref:Uncharacterized protein n=1 Tax=Panicum virgatum TaxID=38727 RepID=A0A8T0MGN6_PANVG|nr:hypothetical protein PVAP13_9NG451619 [Panicum virgatum]
MAAASSARGLWRRWPWRPARGHGGERAPLQRRGGGSMAGAPDQSSPADPGGAARWAAEAQAKRRPRRGAHARRCRGRQRSSGNDGRAHSGWEACERAGPTPQWRVEGVRCLRHIWRAAPLPRQ